MSSAPRLVDVDAASFESLPCCGIKSSIHPGRCKKRSWFLENLPFGLRAKTLLEPGGKPVGYIESIPGEFAWRGVDAAGYLFIHCIWNHSKPHQHQGWGRMMVEDCVAAARGAGRKGVAVVTRSGSWIAGSGLFLATGFEPADTAPPDYELLVRKFNPSFASPKFKRDWQTKVARYPNGLTIIRANQCPYVEKFASEIARAAVDDYGITPRIVELTTCGEAQDAPTPYAVFALIHNGRLLADHPISRTRFRNIMNKPAL